MYERIVFSTWILVYYLDGKINKIAAQKHPRDDRFRKIAGTDLEVELDDCSA